ncbi:isochorismate synthase [Neobacillus sp. PS3-40]|uniref:isochorismate synthase n=1 Tax=Neobacillus sp. PS3-40 TaxID=3070679 RepID=UPI0027E0B965|nr:isochorismate synthase [Neobacillus sp. PS3-40]WML45743.1 isochorismate synthase [Neobacillus sp. PS3-40]
MVTIQETGLKEIGLLAINQAKQMGRSILVSDVHKIDPIDPLLFFHNGRELFLGERFFWKDPSDEMLLIGIGILKQIQSDQAADRFFHVESMWKEFITESMINNPYTENGIGPLMFGGFSFDPYKEKTNLWLKYGESQLHVPKYMLSIIKGQAFFTTNIVCSQNDDLSLFQKVLDERTQLLNSLHKGFQFKSANLLDTKEVSPQEWKVTVDEVVNDLKKGPMKKVVLARELRLFFDDTIEADTVLSHLLEEQRESFIFAFETNDNCFIGASPERLVKKQEEEVFSTCLAGSISRGKTSDEDQLLGDTLLKDQKNLIEHQFVVEMIQNAMEESCEEVILPANPQLMKMRDIQHLYTPVVGKIKKDTSILLLVDRLHPTPALGGLPKKEAIEKIRQVEMLDRGYYAGPLGWIDYKGNGEFAVSIRSGLLQGKEASLFAGCGVVADSDSESEYLETSLKFRPMLTALGGK